MACSEVLVVDGWVCGTNDVTSDVCETQLFTDYNGKKSSVYLVHRGMLDRKWV